jgi:radical SAM protein with 4Fe4S-binding SPASM domain
MALIKDKRKLYYHLVYRPFLLLKKTPLFQHLMLQTNTICTRACDFCHYGQEKKPEAETMQIELIEKILSELKRINYRGRLSLYEINEPLTDRRIVDLVKMAKEAVPLACQVLFTNGDLLTDDIGLKLFKNGLNILIVNSYDNKALKRNLLTVDRLGGNGHMVGHHDFTVRSQWSGRAGNAVRYALGGRGGSCERVFVQMYVKPSGRVPSCVNDFHDTNTMGNAYHSTLQEIWFGEAYERLRRNLIWGRRSVSKLCTWCDYKGYGGYFDYARFLKKTLPSSRRVNRLQIPRPPAPKDLGEP